MMFYVKLKFKWHLMISVVVWFLCSWLPRGWPSETVGLLLTIIVFRATVAVLTALFSYSLTFYFQDMLQRVKNKRKGKI